jgi:tetratricopeptide (TPR) repeat protein
MLAWNLYLQGERDEALSLLRWGRGRHPTDFWIHYDLAMLLDLSKRRVSGDFAQSRVVLEEAIGCYRAALAVRPDSSAAHTNLGNRLADKELLDEAIAEFRKAIDLNPKNAVAHFNFGKALGAKNQLDAAIAEFRKAIDIDPECVDAHYNLGNALRAKEQLDEAVAEYRTTIALQPDDAEAHCNLANCLRLQGKLSASLDSFKRGHALGSKRKDWKYQSADWVAAAERLVLLEAKLPDVLTGKATAADNNERLGLLEVCKVQRRWAAASRVYRDAFAKDAKLADDLNAFHRYNAACYAALAAAGQGSDADKLDDQERARLRKQARDWLRADFDLWVQRLEGGMVADRKAVQDQLKHWQADLDLAGIRDPKALEKLPADEQEACRKLWADVDALLQKADAAK